MIYLEMNTQITNDEEIEADQFASDFLIPTNTFNDIIQHSINEKTIFNYSKKLGIAPGILVGRLQKENKLPWRSRMNSLKIFYKWKK